MKSKIGEFITGTKFGALASKAIKTAVAEADEKGLPKAYSSSLILGSNKNEEELPNPQLSKSQDQ